MSKAMITVIKSSELVSRGHAMYRVFPEQTFKIHRGINYYGM
jgi:hypothetical protein